MSMKFEKMPEDGKQSKKTVTVEEFTVIDTGTSKTTRTKTATKTTFSESSKISNAAAGKTTSKKSRKKETVYYRPKVKIVAIGMSILLAVCTAGTIVSNYSFFDDPFSVADDDSVKMPWNEVFSFGEPVYFMDGETLVYTVPVSKLPKNREVLYNSLTVTVKNSDGKEEDYVSLPRMDLFTDQAYLSGTIIGWEGGTEDLQFEFEPYHDKIDVYTPMRYDYLSRKDNPTEEDILNEYQKFNANDFHDIEILDDGVAEQNGKVTVKLKSKDPDATYQYGDLNIVFKKDGKPVFADTTHYSQDSKAKSDLVHTYETEHKLPAYDSVEVIDLR